MAKGRSVTPRVTADVPPEGSAVEAVLEIDRLFWMDLGNAGRIHFERIMVDGEASPYLDLANESIIYRDYGYQRYRVQVYRWGRRIEEFRSGRYVPVLEITDTLSQHAPSPVYKRAERVKPKADPRDASKGALADYRFTLAGIFNEHRKGKPKKPMTPEQRAEDKVVQHQRQALRRMTKRNVRALRRLVKFGHLDTIFTQESEIEAVSVFA